MLLILLNLTKIVFSKLLNFLIQFFIQAQQLVMWNAKKIHPFGTGNPIPTFLFKDLKIIKTTILQNKHVLSIFKSNKAVKKKLRYDGNKKFRLQESKC